jgi:hypothetical protein
MKPLAGRLLDRKEINQISSRLPKKIAATRRYSKGQYDLLALDPVVCKVESDTPSSRTAFGIGIIFPSGLIATRSSSARLLSASGSDWLREMISKSANLTFRVTVFPRLPMFRSAARPCRSAAAAPRPLVRIQSGGLGYADLVDPTIIGAPAPGFDRVPDIRRTPLARRAQGIHHAARQDGRRHHQLARMPTWAAVTKQTF